MLDYYLEDKIYELVEEMISDNVKGRWFEEPNKYSAYVSYYTGTNEFTKDLAKRLNKAGYARDTEGNRIDWKWMNMAWNYGPCNLRSEGGYDRNEGVYNYTSTDERQQTERLS